MSRERKMEKKKKDTVDTTKWLADPANLRAVETLCQRVDVAALCKEWNPFVDDEAFAKQMVELSSTFLPSDRKEVTFCSAYLPQITESLLTTDLV